MARRNAPKTVDLRAGPTLDIDDDLLSEALAAVEQRAAAPSAPPPADDEADSEVAIDIDTASDDGDEDALGIITIETLGDDMVVALEPAEKTSGGQGGNDDRDSMFEIPMDLLAPDEGQAPPSSDPDDERTDPAGISPRTGPLPDQPKPITADPKMLERVSRMRKRIRVLQRRNDELKRRFEEREIELDSERQGHQLTRSRLRIADNLRQDAEEQRDNVDRFARSLRNRLLTQEEELARLQRRSSHELEQTRQFAADSTIRELLPVLDNLQLALSHANTDPEKFVPGVQMVVDLFRRSLERLGVGFIEASPGTPFDPAVHEAILTLPCEDWPEGSVAEEVRSGYTLKGRLLRASQVSVAGPPYKPRERPVPPEVDDATPAKQAAGEE